MKKKEYLYIFLHIPKCTGSTFNYHIRKNLKKNETLYLNKKIREKYGKVFYDNEEYKDAVENYLSGITTEDKRRIKIIAGHKIPYRIHSHFSRPCRYFTFVRDPIKRTISMYNHLMSDYQVFVDDGKARMGIRKNFIINNKPPDFPEWMMEKYDQNSKKESNLTIFGFLKLWGYVDKISRTVKDFEKDLKKFFYIGLVENYENDSLYLYEKLGIKKYFTSKNISQKHVKLDDSPNLKEEIIKHNRRDIKLYRAAQKMSEELKNELHNYNLSIERAKKSKKLLPITQAIFAPRETLGILKAIIKGETDKIFVRK